MGKSVEGMVDDIDISTGKNKRGGKYTKVTLEIDGEKYGTFKGNSDELDEFLDEVEEGDEVELELEKNGKYWNIKSGEVTDADSKPKKKKKKSKKSDDDDDDDDEKPRKKGKKSSGGDDKKGWQPEDTRRVVYMAAFDKAFAVVNYGLEHEMLTVGSKKANKFDNYMNLIDEVTNRIAAFALTTAQEEAYVSNYEAKDAGEEEEGEEE